MYAECEEHVMQMSQVGAVWRWRCEFEEVGGGDD